MTTVDGREQIIYWAQSHSLRATCQQIYSMQNSDDNKSPRFHCHSNHLIVVIQSL